ncbi:MAG: hypothetical protein K5858_06950 [Lachnospiraceae bacterium]|nr:hypothetical protein [Lachnospiraceae bacterium]
MTLSKENIDIGLIAASGQVFRIKDNKDGSYIAVHRDYVLHIKEDEASYDLGCSKKDFDCIWAEYFDMNTDYEKLIDSINPEDDFLTAAAKTGKGIRILNQDPWEATLCFIISQNNNIPRITGSVNKICERFGKKLEDGIYSIPAPEVFAGLSGKEALSDLGLGYRDEYIYEFCKNYDVYAFLEEVKKLPYEEAMKELMKVKGIGKKVANCICLYGLHMVNACPIDVWVKRIIDEEYGGKQPSWMSCGAAGIYQQYAFYYKRNKSR